MSGVLHYSEGMRIVRNGGVELIGGCGYPVCCSGDPAYAIKAAGNTTDNRLLVTCKRCLMKIRHQIEGRIEEGIA